jgi:hypothetical protein
MPYYPSFNSNASLARGCWPELAVKNTLYPEPMATGKNQVVSLMWILHHTFQTIHNAKGFF